MESSGDLHGSVWKQKQNVWTQFLPGLVLCGFKFLQQLIWKHDVIICFD